MSDPLAEEAIDWFARMHSDRRTRADEDRFSHWLRQSERHAGAYAQVERIYRAAGPQMTPRPLQAVRSERRSQVSRWFAAAAVAAVCVGVYFFLDYRGPVAEGSFVTAAGDQRELRLSDGSTITLNTRSEVSVDIGRDYRLVRLSQGEARFTVAKDAARPFIVDTGAARVRAIGTAFDVRVTDTQLAVTLVEGRVEVAPRAADPAQPHQAVILHAGQQLALDLTSGKQQVRQVSLERANAWLRRQLIFDALPLSEAVEEANRYLSRPVVIEDPSLATMRISGVVRAGSTESFVGSLESSFPVQAMETSAGTVLIRSPD